MLLPLGKILLTKFFFGNFLLTKIMARAKLFSHNDGTSSRASVSFQH
jgi:hypothetical protein